VTISCSHEHEGLLAGTVSITARTLYTVITDIAASLERAEIRKVVLVSGHGGNYVLSNIVQEANITERRMLLYPNQETWVQALKDAGCRSDPHSDMHGGEIETSILLHATPGLVRKGWRDVDHNVPQRPDLLTVGMKGYTTSGIIGRPSLAVASKGAALIDGIVRACAPHLDLLRR